MFTYKGSTMKTWNPWTGCLNDCYNCKCWAKNLIENRLKDTLKFKECGFKPTFHPKEMDKKFPKNDFIFVSSLGDISFAPRQVISQIFDKIKANPDNKFLFCTKNPVVYASFENLENVYYGATIETNRDTLLYSKAPIPYFRYNAMRDLKGYKKFLSIEPIMDFDYQTFITWIIEINPRIVEIGADNYYADLPEPSKEKVLDLINSMEQFGIEVVRKEGLDRLLK